MVFVVIFVAVNDNDDDDDNDDVDNDNKIAYKTTYGHNKHNENYDIHVNKMNKLNFDSTI